jgi:hypothetical protein
MSYVMKPMRRWMKPEEPNQKALDANELPRN